MKKETLLPYFWIFLSVNYIFCDVFSLMLSDYLQQILNGNVGEIIFTEKFLLTFALIMEIPMLMIILSKITLYKLNRLLNIIVGIIMLIIQIGSLAIGENSLHYIFFSTVEIITLLTIIYVAWN